MFVHRNSYKRVFVRGGRVANSHGRICFGRSNTVSTQYNTCSYIDQYVLYFAQSHLNFDEDINYDAKSSSITCAARLSYVHHVDSTPL